MTFEVDAKRGVFNNYGPRVTDGKWGAEIGDEVVKHVVYEVDYADLSSTTITTALHGIQGFDYIFPIGTSFLSARIVVETAVVGPTAITVGTYAAADGTTVINTEGLFTAAANLVSGLDAIGDVMVGTGAQLTTGTTAANGALQAAAVIRLLPTAAVATAGKFKLYVSYLAPTA